MADNGVSAVSSMVSSLNASVDAAVKRLQAQQSASQPEDVKEYQKSVRKSSGTTSFYATDVGILAKNTTRLNVVSNLVADDPVDFYKFKVTSKGEASLGMVGDDGVRVQMMSKTGMVLVDNDKESGKAYDNYLKMSAGEYTMDRGEYTMRVSRSKDGDIKDSKNYALQLQMGTYTQDFDTVAKQPKAGDSPFQLSASQQSMLDGLTNALSNAQSISYGQTGTQKLMGSFSLFV